MNVWAFGVLLACVTSSSKVAASTECKCGTDKTTCTPSDGAIDCVNCGVYYMLEHGDSFVCVKQCPNGYFGSQNILRCVPCSNITEHCSSCSSDERGTPHCDSCESPYTLQGEDCGKEDSSKLPQSGLDVNIVIFIVVLLVVIVCGFCIRVIIRSRNRICLQPSRPRVSCKQHSHDCLQLPTDIRRGSSRLSGKREDDSGRMDADTGTTLQPLRADLDLTPSQSTLSETSFSEINDRFHWTFTVGPAGGIFRVMNIILSIPKDAVDKDVTIRIAVSHNDQDRPPASQSYSVVGPVIHCLPHGLHFKNTIALSFGCNLHLTTMNTPPNLQVLYSDSDVDEVPAWMEHDSTSCNFVVDGSRRCLVFLDHLCVFTVVNKTTGSETLAKGVNALVYGDYMVNARKMRFTSHCVDNEVTEIELFKCIQARDNDAVLVGTQPFIVHDNQNHITLSMSDVAASWELLGNDTEVISFRKVWNTMLPSCWFVLHSTTPDVATEVSCTVTAEQEHCDRGDGACVNVLEDMNKFQETSRHLRQINTTTRLSTIPHRLKMQLASLLDSPDHIRGHDWRHLASVLGLDEKVPYLESKGNQTELLLMVWEMRNNSLSSLATIMRDIERQDAAATIQSFQETTTVEMAETSPKLEEECEIPDDLKTELILLLDPIDEVNGHDWRDFAEQLGRNHNIGYLRRKRSPTEELLRHCEMTTISLPALATMMRTIDREDAAVTIEEYIMR